MAAESSPDGFRVFGMGAGPSPGGFRVFGMGAGLSPDGFRVFGSGAGPSPGRFRTHGNTIWLSGSDFRIFGSPNGCGIQTVRPRHPGAQSDPAGDATPARSGKSDPDPIPYARPVPVLREPV